MRHAVIAVVVLLGLASASVYGDSSSTFAVNLYYDPEGGDGLTETQKAVFAQCATYWENVIAGYQDGVKYMTGVTIVPKGMTIDGVGGILGSTSITGTQLRRAGDGTFYTYSELANITLDIADMENMYNQGYLYEVVMHEMAHTLGFGILWGGNDVYVNGTGHYTGDDALTAFRSEFVGQSGATWVPVELGGGAGTANSHWNEVDGGGSLTTLVDTHGRNMTYELMTGWLNLPGSSAFVSQTTLHQFEDLGYVVAKMLGDTNLDGFVETADLNTLLSNYGSSSATWGEGDFSGEGLVDVIDLNSLLAYYGQDNGIHGIWGSGASAVLAIPEPATICLLLVAAVALAFWGRAKRPGRTPQ